MSDLSQYDRVWTPWSGAGCEHLRLTQYAGGWLADGVIIAVEQGQPFRAHYTIQCDLSWHLREVRVDLLDDTNQRIDLVSDGAGHWSNSAGEALPGLAGCFDIDISATPFTNTLPIRRLALPVGQASDITVVYIALPDMTTQPELQRYTRLADTRYRFEARGSGFTADLPVDEQGLVIDYPGLFRQQTISARP